MKSFFIIPSVIILVVVLVLTLTYSNIGDSQTTDPWYTGGDGTLMVDGDWGTVIEVEYVDGSTEVLGSVLPRFSTYFSDKKVSDFNYILSSRITSDYVESVVIDLSDYDVLVSVANKSDFEIGEEHVFTELVTVDADSQWHEVYRVNVNTPSLEYLPEGVFNMSFKPSGTIVYSSVEGTWNNIPLPGWFYVKFTVHMDDVAPPPNDSYWIEVDLDAPVEGD